VIAYGDNVNDSNPVQSPNYSSSSDDAAYISWTWMFSNQFSWYQIASGKLMPKSIDKAFHERTCQHYLNRNISSPMPVKDEFGNTDPKSSLVLFSHGTLDPWSGLGIQKADPVDQILFYQINFSSQNQTTRNRQ
jgi:hypothetical protein